MYRLIDCERGYLQLSGVCDRAVGHRMDRTTDNRLIELMNTSMSQQTNVILQWLRSSIII